MAPESRLAFACLIAWISLVSPPALGAEPTEAMRTLARMFAAVETRDLHGYCKSKFTAPYVDYLNRVCQSAVQNKVKTPEDCSQAKIADQVKSDAAQCLAMPAAEFDATVVRGQEGRNAFVAEMKAQGIDGNALIKEASAKRP